MTASTGDSTRPPFGTPGATPLPETPPAGDDAPGLIAGIPGQGKSGALNLIAAELAAREGGPHARA